MSTPFFSTRNPHVWQRLFTHLLDGLNLYVEFVVFVPCAFLFLVRAVSRQQRLSFCGICTDKFSPRTLLPN